MNMPWKTSESAKKGPTDLPEMVEALARQVRLLEVYELDARSDSDYLGEVALKLRLLLIDSRKQKALLRLVAQSYKADLVFGVTPDGTARRWRDLLDAPVITVGGVTMTLKEFIRAWVAQVGRTSEDWALDQMMLRALTSVRINRRSLTQSDMHSITRQILAIARALLDQVGALEQSSASPTAHLNGRRDGPASVPTPQRRSGAAGGRLRGAPRRS
jgi:hypothetical protein